MNRDSIGIVVIGRNEGERLRKSLTSCAKQCANVVYIDSGSHDKSVDVADELKIPCLQLDTNKPFSAARARNEGAEFLLNSHPSTQYIQFVDGDCILANDWINNAESYLAKKPSVGLLCGYTIEEKSDATCYNRLCHLEWDRTLGMLKATGGIFMVRRNVFEEIEGFNSSVIAAEDDEFCIRLRNSGHQIERIDMDMAYHDVNMVSIFEWWQRAKRSGHAFAQVFDIHGKNKFPYFKKELKSAVLLGGVIPLIGIFGAIIFSPWIILLWTGYIFLMLRIYNAMRKKDYKKSDAWLYALHCVFIKLPQFVGVLQFYINKKMNRTSTIIEY